MHSKPDTNSTSPMRACYGVDECIDKLPGDIATDGHEGDTGKLVAQGSADGVDVAQRPAAELQ